MAVVSVPFGMVVDKFHPKDTGDNWTLSPTLAPLAKLRQNFTAFSGLDHAVNGGHAANHTLLSGIKITERAGYPDGNVTVDQRAAELIGHQTRFPSLVFWRDGMSYTRTGVRVPALEKPSDAFNLMFVNDTEDQKKFNRATLRSSGSILDTVLEDARNLQRELSTNDRQKLEEYFSSIRETEKKIEISKSWLDRDKPVIKDKAMKRVAAGSRDDKLGSNQVEIWMDLMLLALQTDSTRIVSMASNNCNWGLEGVTDSYHTLSHHGQRDEVLAQLAIVEEFLMKNFARFIQRLKEVKDAEDRPLLDSTQVLFGSGLGSGSRHSNVDLPLILAGGDWKHGRHLHAHRKQPLCNLYLSMLKRMGAEQDYFNRSNGTLTGLS
jgi:hypothetical protein|tara:strand:- start:1135 stop:2268 length:1134 start_codon:yes stop_codon:yes gene_type:complete